MNTPNANRFTDLQTHRVILAKFHRERRFELPIRLLPMGNADKVLRRKEQAK